ncbi:MAG: PEGA domain-containing protein [Planctomycetes bacterium]|nr:PEGA domain-containing protein [Planctomycetota bacterium]
MFESVNREALSWGTMVDAHRQQELPRRRLGSLGRVASAGLLIGMLAGCVERTISITSEPPGALVYLNDEEVGRTPCEVHFLYYGEYDVRLVLEGFEPLMGSAKANAPLYELPGLDLAAELFPAKIRNRVMWHFDLEPVSADREQMIGRARDLRDRLHETLGVDEATVAADDGVESSDTDSEMPADEPTEEPNDSRTPETPLPAEPSNGNGTPQKSE